ncbi:MAG: hypothetical protein EXQ86_06890 [Rhodospirillales bacterium]|nr:hypothetical protein [Rhodospirillales bacterium]
MGRRAMMTAAAAGLAAALPGCGGFRSGDREIPPCRGLLAPPGPVVVPVADRRIVNFRVKEPRERWAGLLRERHDIAALRALAKAMKVHMENDFLLRTAWRIGSPALYHLAYADRALYIEDSDYFADILGADVLTRAQMAVLQHQYTLAHAFCSTVIAYDERAGGMVHFRSVDWPMSMEIAMASRIYDFRDDNGSIAFSAAGILGMVGVLSAIGEGFSVAINYAPWREGSASFDPDPTLLLRRLMEGDDMRTYRQAYDAIGRWRPGAPVFVSLCGVRAGEGCVFEFGLGRDGKSNVNCIEIDNRRFLVHTNHFAAGSPFAAENPRQVLAVEIDRTWNHYRLRETSEIRRRMIVRDLEASGSAGLEETLMKTYSQEPIWNCETAQWVMMTPRTGRIGEIKLWARA